MTGILEVGKCFEDGPGTGLFYVKYDNLYKCTSSVRNIGRTELNLEL